MLWNFTPEPRFIDTLVPVVKPKLDRFKITHYGDRRQLYREFKCSKVVYAESMGKALERYERGATIDYWDEISVSLW